MVKSMTGFGRCKESIDGRNITVEVKSVNSRYTDVSMKVPRLYSPLEDRLKQLCLKYISRGKIDIYLSVELPEGEKVSLAVNRDYLESYLSLLEDIKKQYSPTGDITLSMIAAKQDIFVVSKAEEDVESVWESVKTVAESAMRSFVEMREREGEKMKADVLLHLGVLAELREKIAERAPAAIEESNTRMKNRIAELLGNVQVDESRLLTECAVFTDKADISEELARLESHIHQFRKILDTESQVGRKLDFLVQEMNREVNTTGSKSNDESITAWVIDAKCTLERIREQIQNLE